MNDILPILLFLSTEGLWFTPTEVQTWSEWTLSGELQTSFRRETLGEHSWCFLHKEIRYDITLSEDHQDILVFSMTDTAGKTSTIGEEVQMWYVPQTRIDVASGITEVCPSPMGDIPCQKHQHTDREENRFTWYHTNSVPGGVVQAQASFAGEPRRVINFTMQRFGVLSTEKSPK